MVHLAIDTANEICAVALSKQGTDEVLVLAKDQRRIGRGHAEVLIPQIDELISSCGITPKLISQITVTVGPGSFAGTRVGIAVARMLSASLGVPLIGVGVLPALLFEALSHLADGKFGDSSKLFAVLDARRSQCYVASTDIRRQQQSPPALMWNDDLIKLFRDHEGGLVLTGSGRNLFSSMENHKIRLLEIDFPDIETISMMGHSSVEEKLTAEPLYLRNADAKKQTGASVPILE